VWHHAYVYPFKYLWVTHILPRTLKKYQDFLDLILTWHLLSRQKTADSLSYARQCIKEGQTVLMTKMPKQHSWKTSKNVFNFIMCYHVRRSKGLAIYYLLHPSCPFIYVVFSNFITINTNQMAVKHYHHLHRRHNHHRRHHHHRLHHHHHHCHRHHHLRPHNHSHIHSLFLHLYLLCQFHWLNRQIKQSQYTM